jgi:aminoglycoside phosphotransferase (APT) family kinase protein
VAAGLTALADGDLPRLLKYKPLSRAVFRLDGHFVKAHPSQSSLDRSARALRAVGGLRLRTATLEAVVPEWHLEVQSLVAGDRPESAAEAAPAAGALLAELHRSPLPDLPISRPADRLAENAEDVLLVGTIAPALARRARLLLRRLDEEHPGEPPVTSHGGFHISQLLEDVHGTFGVIDFDGACLAPAALDVASYAVSLVREPADLPRALEALDGLCETYGSRPAAIPWYLSSLLLRRTRFPFTRLRNGWLAGVGARLAAAEAALDLGWP